MLYQTHHPFFLPLNTFTTPILPLSTTTITPLPPPIQGMDCVEGALKSSFGPERAVKNTQNQPVMEDSSTVNGQSVVVSADDFFVDDLLDFSDGGVEDGFCKEEEKAEEEDKESDSRRRSKISVIDDFPSVPCSELSVPADDLADLEWLSNFVEDSFSNYSLQYTAGKLPEKPTDHRSQPQAIAFQIKPCFKTPVHTKARSKRSRTGFRVWSLDSPTSSTSSSSTTQMEDSILGPPLLLPTTAKKQRKKNPLASAGGFGVTQQSRRCSHCFVQKTPQWRAGPLGAKTLCNACGVRFKSGRLLPEYRPACSPTFSSEVHSNNHRKVLEMRQKKEGEAGLAPPVQRFDDILRGEKET